MFFTPPALSTHLPRKLLILHAQSLLLTVLFHHHRLKIQILDFLPLFPISSPAASCSPPATRTQSLLELRAAPSDLPPERNGFQLMLYFRLIRDFFAHFCFHLCTQFLHGNLGVVKHLELLLKPHLKLLLSITPSTWNELIHANELCWAQRSKVRGIITHLHTSSLTLLASLRLSLVWLKF